MATEVVMPQMGESITEGTITKWLKKVGDTVEKEEMIFEISTDKVDAEIPSPTAGVLLEIRGSEGDTLEVGTVVAIVGEAGESGAAVNASSSMTNGASTNGNAAQTQTAPTSATAPPAQEGTAAEVAGRSYDYGERPGATAQAQETLAQNQPNPAQTEQQTTANSAPTAADGNGDSAASGGARTEVVMPQMGESITEGTITKWLKKQGDAVEKEEMIFEISTDKVDAEIPSPVAGILLEIRGNEGDTLEVGTVVAVIGASGANGAAAQTAQTAAPQIAQSRAPISEQEPAAAQNNQVQRSGGQTAAANGGIEGDLSETSGRSYDYQGQTAEIATQTGGASVAQPSDNGKSANGASVEDLRRTKSSPLVRKIAEEHKIDISRITGSGASGRVTKDDILSFISSGAALTPQQAQATAKSGAALPAVTPATAQTQASSVQPAQQFVQPQTTAPTQTAQIQAQTLSAPTAAAQDRVEPMSVMRKKIAQHMVMSKQTSAHVTSVYEIDMTPVVRFRDKHKNEFQQRYGTKLTFMPFIFQAVTAALRKFPVVNAQVSGDNIIYKGDLNLGMAVALDWGLIVPVIKRADTLSLAGLALAANDLADRARTKKLVPDEVAGGTFTITNPGVFGGLYGTPIINQPQVAILCVGTIEKRAKVITSPEGDDLIAIRSMAYFALTYDHRIIDGSEAEKFLSFLKATLESGQFSL